MAITNLGHRILPLDTLATASNSFELQAYTLSCKCRDSRVGLEMPRKLCLRDVGPETSRYGVEPFLDFKQVAGNLSPVRACSIFEGVAR